MKPEQVQMCDMYMYVILCTYAYLGDVGKAKRPHEWNVWLNMYIMVIGHFCSTAGWGAPVCPWLPSAWKLGL